jgi:hypothetical protein
MRKSLFAVVAVAMLVFAGSAFAGKVGHAKLWEYDPNETGDVVATWTKDGLSLQKNAATSVAVAAGATIKGVEGEKLESLSYEIKGDHCTGGAPRFNVVTDTATHFFGCIYGTTTSLDDGWTKVTFDDDVVGASGAFGSTMKGVDVVMDEEGQTLLRNLSVNGVVINK